MLVQQKKNRWSCLTCAFAMVMDVTQEELESIMGKDGEEVLLPHLPSDDVERHRGIHIQELIDAAETLGYTIVTIERIPTLALKDGSKHTIFGDGAGEQRFADHIDNSKGVIYGVSAKLGCLHALAWDGKSFYDPDTGTRAGSLNTFSQLIGYFKVVPYAVS